MDNKKYYSVLQSLEVVPADSKHDIEVFGQCYKVPSSGVSPTIESGSASYRYDFGKKELVLLSDSGNDVYRKSIDPKTFVKGEYKWLKIAKEEARITLGLDDCY